MNGQNNNFNSQFNSQPTNQNVGGQPTQPVKSKFFSPDLFNDSSVNDVGSSTSSSVNNNVISWGVGQKKTSSGSNQVISNNAVNNQGSAYVTSEQLLEQVNGDVYEVLDDEFLMGNNTLGQQSPQVNNQIGIENTPLFQEANNVSSQQTSFNNRNQMFQQPVSVQQPQLNQQYIQQPLNQGMQQQPLQQYMPQSGQSIPGVQQPIPVQQPMPGVQQPMPVQQPENNIQDQSWKNGIGVVQPTGEDWMQQQPLSAASLGVGSINGAELAKDVVEESKFFNPNINKVVEEQQQSQQEQQQQFAMQYGNGQGVVLEDHAPEIDDNALLRQYVGSSFQKISMAPFSFPAFIFSGIYFMYRKMFLLGAILFLMEFAIVNLLPNGIAQIAVVAFHIVLALVVNPVYIKIAKGRVKGIKKSKKNKNKNQIELNTICQSKGGTSLSKTFILTIICSILGVAIAFVFLSGSLIAKIFNFIDVGIIDNEPAKYEGTIATSDYDVLGNMNIEIPSSFKKDGETFSYTYTSNGTGVFNTCTLSIGKLHKFTSGEDFINQYIEYEKLDVNIGKTTTKGITWYTVVNENSVGKQFYRAADINDEVVLFDFSIGADTPTGVCDAYLVDIIDSISLKEK